jgi:ADP-heptose:LPS heptosyltransferase
MKKILVLNFTRIGDLIQTTPLFAGLKEEDPSREITLACTENFALITEHIPSIDKVVTFDMGQFINNGPQGYAVLDIYRYLDQFIKNLKGGGFDTLINLTYSHISGVMGKMLAIPHTRGVCYTDDGYRAVHDKWLMYFSTVTHFRRYNTFNLVDIYQLGGGVKPKGRRLPLDVTGPEIEGRELLNKMGIGPSDRIIGIQAGASKKERRWPAVNFARTADLLAEKWGAKIVFFGVESEKPLIDEIISNMASKGINLAGATTIKQLIGVTKNCFLLVTNDTATMHIAAAANIPIVGLFLVHAFARETGPYCEGAVILEPNISCFPCAHSSTCPHYACMDYITPLHAVKASEMAIDLKNGKTGEPDPAGFEKVALSRTVFDKYGFYDLVPILKREATETDIFARIYRILFQRPELGKEAKPHSLLKELENYITMPGEELTAWAEKKQDIFEQLIRFTEDGINLVNKIRLDYKNGKFDKMQNYADSLAKIDETMEVHAMSHPEVSIIVRMFIIGRSNMQNVTVEAMLERGKMLYTDVKVSSDSIVEMLGELQGNNVLNGGLCDHQSKQ